MSNVLCVAFMWVGVHWGGLAGTGMAFFCHYLVMFVAVLLLVRRLVGFRWSVPNLRLLAVAIPSTLGVFVASFLLPTIWFTVLAALVTVVVGVWCVRLIIRLLGETGLANLKAKFRRLLPQSK